MGNNFNKIWWCQRAKYWAVQTDGVFWGWRNRAQWGSDRGYREARRGHDDRFPGRWSPSLSFCGPSPAQPGSGAACASTLGAFLDRVLGIWRSFFTRDLHALQCLADDTTIHSIKHRVFLQGGIEVIANARAQRIPVQLSLAWNPFLLGSQVFSSQPVHDTIDWRQIYESLPPSPPLLRTNKTILLKKNQQYK